MKIEAMILVLLTSLAPIAGSDQITGQVVDSNGVGVQGVNIDAFDLVAGVWVTVQNDGTDANGMFTTDFTSPGLYRIVFIPPAPPTTTHLVLEVDDVTVIGTTNMGVLALEPGVALSGTVRAPGGAPVGGIELELEQDFSPVTLDGPTTNAFGVFNFAAPIGDVDLLVDPSSAGQLLAPESLPLTLTSNTNLGDIQLEAGFVVTATVMAGGSPVQNADFDVVDVVSDEEQFTPGDNTDGNGAVSFVVGAGTYDFELCPQFADLLVAVTLKDIVIPGGELLGQVNLQPGVILSGHVMDTGGTSVGNVDLDLRDSVSQVAVALCSDNTNASGNYAIVVPTGTFDVTFMPPLGETLSPLVVTNYAVTGNQILNATLQDGGGNYCQSNPFSTGQTSTIGSNTGTASIAANDLVLTADNLPSQPGQFIASGAPFETPFQNGFLCVSPTGLQRLLPIGVPNASGVATLAVDFVSGAQGLTGSLPVNVVAGTTHYFQRWNRDPGVGTGSNLSDGIAIAIVP